MSARPAYESLFHSCSTIFCTSLFDESAVLSVRPHTRLIALSSARNERKCDTNEFWLCFFVALQQSWHKVCKSHIRVLCHGALQGNKFPNCASSEQYVVSSAACWIEGYCCSIFQFFPSRTVDGVLLVRQPTVKFVIRQSFSRSALEISNMLY